MVKFYRGIFLESDQATIEYLTFIDDSAVGAKKFIEQVLSPTAVFVAAPSQARASAGKPAETVSEGLERRANEIAGYLRQRAEEHQFYGDSDDDDEEKA